MVEPQGPPLGSLLTFLPKLGTGWRGKVLEAPAALHSPPRPSTICTSTPLCPLTLLPVRSLCLPGIAPSLLSSFPLHPSSSFSLFCADCLSSLLTLLDLCPLPSAPPCPLPSAPTSGWAWNTGLFAAGLRTPWILP